MTSLKRTSLFQRLMMSVALPEIIIFSVVAVISYIQLKYLFEDISKQKVENLREELISIIKFQDVSLAQVSHNLEHSAQDKMKKLRYDYFFTSDSIERANLSRIKDEIGMHPTDDIYIINKSGSIINTTSESDRNFNLLNITDHEFTEFIKGLFFHDYYSPQPMTLEINTRRFKKFIYQSSRDHKYIIQLGFYSTEAGHFNDAVAQRLQDIEKSPSDIKSIDLILAPWNPFSLYKGKDIDEDDVPLLQEIFKNGKDSVIENVNERISYIFFEKADNETIEWEGILKVVYDKNHDRDQLFLSLIQKVSFFGIGMVLLLIILYFNVKMITKPILHLSQTARKLGEGNLSNRAESSGTREMVFLADSFNSMAGKLEKSHTEIRQKNEEILASINYARRIQEAILPPLEVVEAELKQSFIFYRPKDVVAGDFYWFEVMGDDIFIAAADCTGHGVPGAMVSVVCSGALNRAVKEMNIREPSKILDAVRDIVIQTFEKSHHDVKDGMDIALVKVNRKNRTIVFSGAQNPLYRVTRKGIEVAEDKRIEDGDHHLLEYKGDKQPIGKFTFHKPFTQTLIQCDEGDSIYLFTDGYADQFGGKEGRKLMYKPFKKLLLSMREKDMTIQKKMLEDAFEKWKGNESQIDDVCVMGFRI